MKASRVIAGGPWRGLVRSRAITLRGVRALLAQIFKVEPTLPPGVGVDFADLTDEKVAWRRNLFTETEFRNGLADGPVRGGAGIAAATLTGYAGAVQFTYDSAGSYFYKQFTPVAGARYALSVIVQMNDGGAPTFGGGDAANALNDFVLVVRGDATSPTAYAVTPLGVNNLYRVSCVYVNNTATLGNWGIVKYGGNSSRAFKATAYQLERSAVVTPYQALTDVATEFLAAYPLHALYQDHVANVPVWSPEQTIGFAVDMRQGGARGVEVNPDVGMNNAGLWSYAGTAPLWSVANGVGQCTATAQGNRWITSGTTITSGKWYEIYADVTVVSGGCLPDISANYAVFANKTGRWHWILFATTTSMQFLANGGFVGSIDNVSFRELPGQHALQPTANERPIADGKLNRLLYTEDLTTGYFKADTNVTRNTVAVTPRGQQGGATTVNFTAANGYVGQLVNRTTYAGLKVAISLYATTQTRLIVYGGATPAGTDAYSIEDVGGGWYRQKIVRTFTAATTDAAIQLLVSQGMGAVVGTDYLVWGTQLEFGPSVTAYQRVSVATDYEAIGWPKGARFNGTSHWMFIPGLDLSTIDRLVIVASVRKDVETALGMIFEHGPLSTADNPGSFRLQVPTNLQSYAVASTGTVSTQSTGPSNYPAPATSVVSAVLSIGAMRNDLRINGAIVASNAASQGTGNYSTRQGYIGRREGATALFNGVMYRLAIRGGGVPDNFVALMERWANEPIKVLA